MQISNNFNTNFGALFGKKEITTKYGKNNDVEITTIQHVYPFKDEFQSKKDMRDWLRDLRQSSFYKQQNEASFGVSKKYSVIIEPALPFSKETFEHAKKDGVQLLHDPSSFYTVTNRYEGYYPAYTFENGKFECVV